MSNDKSLLCAYLLDEEGGGRKLSWQDVESWTEDQGVLWVHLDYRCKRSLQWLNKNSGLDKISAKAMAVVEARPRTIISPKGILVFLRSLNLRPGAEPEDMVSIRLWIDKHRIISTCRHTIYAVSDVQSAIEESIGPKSPVEFLQMLNDRLTDKMSDFIENLDTQVDALEQEVITAESRLLRPKIADLRRQTIEIRRYLAPQREALNRLYLEPTELLDANDRLHMREATDRVIRYIEDLDSARERAAVSQEELMSRLSEQLDRRMYILSVVAVIFLPLTFLTGLLGINVGGIPGANNKWGFLTVCGILGVLLVVMLGFLRRKKWM